MSALLEVNGLRKRFGGVQAVDDCSFAVERGTVTGLIGPNGSGKTTVFNLVTGYLPADAGSVIFDGQIVSRPDPVRLARRGLIRTFQQARVFPQLTALENLVLAVPLAWWKSAGRRVQAAERARGEELLADFNLAGHAQVPAAELSFGQRKLLEFAATLMSRPSVVLLDEPTSGVNPVLMETIESHIRRLNEEGLTFLVVEHDMPLVMRLCDPVIVLDRGRKIAEGTAVQVQSDPRCPRRLPRELIVRVVLEGVVAGYGFGDVLRGLDLVAEDGEITCLIGPNGAGKSTVLRAVSGLLQPRLGSIKVGDHEIAGVSPRAMLELGVVHVPQERSLFPLMTVWENLLMGAYILRDRNEVRRRADALVERFPLLSERRAERAGSLSGGEQKTVEIARALMLEPRVLLIDEPSIGLAPRARSEVFTTLASLSEGGWTILLVEQNARSGLAIADRGAVLDGGVVPQTAFRLPKSPRCAATGRSSAGAWR